MHPTHLSFSQSYISTFQCTQPKGAFNQPIRRAAPTHQARRYKNNNVCGRLRGSGVISRRRVPPRLPDYLWSCPPVSAHTTRSASAWACIHASTCAGSSDDYFFLFGVKTYAYSVPVCFGDISLCAQFSSKRRFSDKVFFLSQIQNECCLNMTTGVISWQAFAYEMHVYIIIVFLSFLNCHPQSAGVVIFIEREQNRVLESWHRDIIQIKMLSTRSRKPVYAPSRYQKFVQCSLWNSSNVASVYFMTAVICTFSCNSR